MKATTIDSFREWLERRDLGFWTWVWEAPIKNFLKALEPTFNLWFGGQPQPGSLN